jgi:hypothetical protein
MNTRRNNRRRARTAYGGLRGRLRRPGYGALVLLPVVAAAGGALVGLGRARVTASRQRRASRSRFGPEMTRSDLEEMGPVDYLCLEFPEGSLNGTAFPLLVDLVDRRIIRVLDILFLRKDADGKVVELDGGDPELAELGVFHGAASGMLGGDDLRDAGEVLEPGAAAALLVYENLWAAPLAVRLRRNGAQLVAGGRIPIQALLAALDETEPEPDAAEAMAVHNGAGAKS